MSTTPAHRPYRSMSTSLTIVGMWAAAAVLMIAFLMHAVVWVVATLTGHRAPSLRETLSAIRTDLTNPVAGYDTPVGPGPLIYTVTLVLVTAVLVGGFWVVLGVAARRMDRATGSTTVKDLAPIAREQATATARKVLPAGTDLAGDQLILRLGALRGTEVFGQHEDSYCLVAPARSGKTTLAVSWVLDAPGPVVATGTKNDLLFLTATRRLGVGKVLALDPVDIAGWPHLLRWNPVVGCADPDEALERGRAWAAGDPAKAGGRNSEWFNARAGEVLAYLLHAAALKPDGSMRDVVRWAADFDDDEPVELLAGSPHTEQVGWADLLKARTRSRAGETTDSLRMTLSGLLAPLSSPKVLATVCPPDGEEFDAEQFLAGPNTIYLLLGAGASNAAPLVTMLTDYVVRTAQRISQHRPAGRLWPPLRLVLDEAANVTPLPGLPALMSDSGGRGITTMVICQSFAQMDERWGKDGAEGIRANATVTMYLPGIKETDRLRALSEATGRYRAKRVSYSTGSVSTSSEWENVMSPDDIRRMPTGTGLMFYRGLKAAHLDLTPWWERPDHDQVQADRAHIAQLTGRAMQ